MFSTFKNYFFVILLLLSANVFAAELTKENVSILLSKADAAVSNLDADGVANVLSDNVILIVSIKTKEQTQVLTLSKQEFILMLKFGWLSVESFKHSRTNEVIKRDGDKMIVTADVLGTMTVNGQNNNLDAKVEATIESINKNILITRLVAYTII